MASKKTQVVHQYNDVTRYEVERLASLRIDKDDIAIRLGITAQDIDAHYQKDFDMGRIVSTEKVRESLLNMATREGDPDLNAIKEWIKLEISVSTSGVAAPSGKKESAQHRAQAMSNGKFGLRSVN